MTLLPQRFHNRFFDLIDILRWKFIKHLKNYVSDESFQQRLNSFILQQLNLTLAHDLKHYLTPERQHQTQEKLEPLLERWLTSNSLSENVSTFIDSRIDTVICSGKSLKQLLPAEIIDTILNQLEDELPALLQQLATNLNDPRMRKELEKKARGGIESFIDSVEGLSAIITALFDMEKIYSRLPEFMDKAALELATWLEGEKVRSEISTAMRERINNWLDQPLANYLEKVSYEKIINIKRFISTRVITFIRSNNCRQLVVEWLNKGIDTIKDRPLSELLNEAGGEDCAAKLAEQITTKAVQITQSPQLQQTVEAELEQKVNFWINERPLGNLASRLPSDAREELYHALFEQLLELLNKEVPPLVDSLDIRRIVEDKVNSLDILKVEELLMGIMKEQFKYINIFGALLGMLIGMLNIFLLR
ncbi:MAG: hypothetical protein B6I36_09405 [Desulfobacteraceae bacterium 4572_35.1]|nr:MAG: hypothetical protein B6I36_09405 [Desulfobacteraceae bacterium 4572_35.1]